MRSLKVAFFAGMICLALLAGCDAEAAAPIETPKTVEGEAVIIYQRGGGLMGGSETWQFFADGKVTHTARNGTETSASLPAADVQGLVDEINKLGFADLKARYLSNENCRDCYHYTISLRQDDGTLKQVETQDAEPGAPLALTQIIERLNLAAQAAK